VIEIYTAPFVEHHGECSGGAEVMTGAADASGKFVKAE
jgi:hypothetical protein